MDISRRFALSARMVPSITSAAPTPTNEPARQQTVDRALPQLSRKQSQLRDIVERAARAFDVPMAAVSIIDRNRQKLVAQVGMAQDETTRDVAFCAHAIHRPGELTIVHDAAKDERFARNPLVTGSPHIRFYAGKRWSRAKVSRSARSA